ncbi:MAG TPA: fibronectin type III domain-containing protein [Fimbriimonadaceae bacterium]|nr:fibronectin type III domain-containing protein [Fimbriimonadaceae bacterium]HRJ97963.1 fibronectin type III domain-containing protein [Fimbriimonadaceae bacterium]
MPYITEIDRDGDLNLAMANFSAVCAANATPLGLTGPMLGEIDDAATDFATSLASSTAAKAAQRAAVEAKDEQKTSSREIISKYAKIFRANAAIDDSLLAELMLPPHNTPGSQAAPTTPTDLVANANGDGVTSLKWNRNGNIRGTTFQVEKRTSPEGSWTIVDTTTRRRLVTMTTPGQYVAFRVIAARNDMASPPSTPVVLWDGSGESETTLAIAA